MRTVEGTVSDFVSGIVGILGTAYGFAKASVDLVGKYIGFNEDMSYSDAMAETYNNGLVQFANDLSEYGI
jgi:hypothetical protein